MTVRKKLLMQIFGFGALTVALPMASLSIAQQPEPPRTAPGSPGAAQDRPADPPTANTPPSGPPSAPSSAQAIPGSQASSPFSVPTPVPIPAQFVFQIPTNTPTKDLLPKAPKMAKIAGPVLADDLTQIPEITFEAKVDKVQGGDPTQLTKHAAYQIAKINHGNAKKTDGFMTALIDSRPDLAGMPFRMGEECRTTGAKVQHFNQAAEMVRRSLGNQAVGQPPVMTQQVFVPQTVLSTNNSVTSQAIAATEPASPVTPPTAATGAPAAPVPPAPIADAATTTVAPTSSLPQLVQQPQQMQMAIAPVTPISASAFWQSYAANCDQEDAARGRQGRDKETVEMVRLARIAALTQILAAESAEIRLGLVRYLGGVPHIEATKALARMILFSPEEDVRAAAIAALKVRREKDYTDILLSGLRYPWPAVSKRSADAIAKLERTDLVPELLAVLEASDPRLPEEKEVDGKVTVREMVKLNHHRNCMLCHPPSGSGAPNPNALQAEVAVQDQPLPSPSDGYRQNRQDLLIRIDATYLRPDFSASIQVKDAHPWPEMQRFDFLVRERKLTKEEAASYREQLKQKEEGVISPYHKGAVAALRDLTGKDAAPTAEAWRKLLNKTEKN